jgi:D-sedoheptulose 7-phosphate isomerase
MTRASPHDEGTRDMDVPAEPRQVAVEYLTTFRGLLDQIDFDAVARTVDRLRGVRDRGGTVYVAGNGGSAATATHLVNDLGKATKRAGCPMLRVMCLTDNVSWLTALANDEGYERVFTGQLENFAEPGDLLIVISASGNSPNLVNVVDYANAHGVQTVALLGFDGGVLKDRVHERLWLSTPIGLYGPVESGHSVLCDILTTCLMQDSIRESTRVAQRQSA